MNERLIIMNKEDIIKKLRAIRTNPVTEEEWMETIDRLYNRKTYQEFRKDRCIELKEEGYTIYKDILAIISREWKEYKNEKNN